VGNAFYIAPERVTLSGVQKRDGWVVQSVAIADTEQAARHAIGAAARGWRSRVFCRSVRAGGCDLPVYVGVLLKRAERAKAKP